MKKTLKCIGLGLISILLILGMSLGLMFGNEIQTINSIKKVDEYGMYEMTYTADYGLDKLIASGGVENDGALVNFVIDNLLKGLPIDINIPDFGCSTFQAQNEQGDWLFGRNYDLDYVPGMIVKTKPDNGYASISVSNMAVAGYNEEKRPEGFKESVASLAAPYLVMDGMNEKGFSMGVLLIRDVEATNQNTDKLDLTTTSAMRYLLDKAGDVNEAIKLLENMDMHASANASYHFQMADADGNSAVVEYIDDQLNIIRKEDDEFQALTNFLISEEMYGFGRGQDRYEILINTLNEKNGVLSEEESMDLLKTVSQDKINQETGKRSSTQWSVVYNNTKKTAKIVAGMNYENVIEVSLFD